MLKGALPEQVVRSCLAAEPKLIRKLPKKHGTAPFEWVPYKCRAYRTTPRERKLQRAVHPQSKRANTWAESSHVPVRRREWKVQESKTSRSAHRFLSIHTVIYNIHTAPRHLTTARIHRLLRAEGLCICWDAADVADNETYLAALISARLHNVTSPSEMRCARRWAVVAVHAVNRMLELGHSEFARIA